MESFISTIVEKTPQIASSIQSLFKNTTYLYIFGIILAIIIISIVIKMFKSPMKFILKFFINMFIGYFALFIWNYICNVISIEAIATTPLNVIVIGVLGFPGVIILIVLSFF